MQESTQPAHGVAVQGGSKPYSSLLLRHAKSGGVNKLETQHFLLLLHILLFPRLRNGVVLLALAWFSVGLDFEGVGA